MIDVAGWVPVSTTLLADNVPNMVLGLIEGLLRKLTAQQFNESWAGAEGEMDRLEHGLPLRWDSTVWEDESWCPSY